MSAKDRYNEICKQNDWLLGMLEKCLSKAYYGVCETLQRMIVSNERELWQIRQDEALAAREGKEEK